MPTSSSSIRVAPMSASFARLAGAAAEELAACYAAEKATRAAALGFACLAGEVRGNEAAYDGALAAMNAANSVWDELRPATDEAWARLVALVGDAAPAWAPLGWS